MVIYSPGGAAPRQLRCVCGSHGNCAPLLPRKAGPAAPPSLLGNECRQGTKQLAGREMRGEERDRISWLARHKSSFQRQPGVCFGVEGFCPWSRAGGMGASGCAAGWLTGVGRRKVIPGVFPALLIKPRRMAGVFRLWGSCCPLCRAQSKDERGGDECTGARRQQGLGSWEWTGPQLLPSWLLGGIQVRAPADLACCHLERGAVAG